MPLLRYTLLRLAVLAGTLGLLWLLGLRGLLLALVAVVVAALVSFLVLPRYANDAAAVLARRGRREPGAVERAIAEDAAAEDALLDEQEDETPER